MCLAGSVILFQNKCFEVLKKNVQGFSESIRTGTGSVVQKFICPPDCFQVKSNLLTGDIFVVHI